MSEESLYVSTTDGVMTIQLNRPQALNAVTPDLVYALDAAIDRAQSEARAVIITGDARSFSSGADLAASSNGEKKVDILDIINKLMLKIRDLKVPTIAAVSGPAAGVGCSLALICDYVVMDPSAYLMLAFTKIGLMPDGGATALVAASAGRHRALRMALNAEKIHAETAFEWGLATEVTAEGEYLSRAQEIAERFANGPTLSLGETEYAINKITLGDLEEALEQELTGQNILRASSDYVEGVQAFREKRPAVFAGK
jgi:enoyl-CoA hydratase